MEKDYTDIENITIAEYKVVMKRIEDKIIEDLRNKNLQELKKYIKLHFKLSKLYSKKILKISKENSRSSR